jgi:AcrR family transcriptional regulator
VPARIAYPTERILESAGHLFGTRRFHEVRMDDIAAATAISKGTLYRYFKDKEALFLALLEQAARQLTQQAEEEVHRAQGARCRLVTLVDTIIRFFDEHPHLLDLIQRAEVMRGRSMPWQQTRDELLKMVLDLFEQGREQGEFAVADADLGALLLLGGLRSVLRFAAPPRPPDLSRRIVERFLNGYDQGPQWRRAGAAMPAQPCESG